MMSVRSNICIPCSTRCAAIRRCSWVADDLMESMVLQLYDQIPIQASAPEHAEAKGHSCAPLEPRAWNSISNPTSTGITTQDMERCQESEMGNTHGMNGDFMKTNCRLYVQGNQDLLLLNTLPTQSVRSTIHVPWRHFQFRR